MDVFRDEKTDEKFVIDSSKVMGAQVIISWIRRKKETAKEAKRRITMQRRKTLRSRTSSLIDS